jgi:enoyl-CoA hydratase/carnithine racemase
MKDRVSIDFKDGVADVRLIRAEKMNALDPAMFEGIIEAGDQLAKMKGLRAVVLSGEGKAFCAGLDMGSFAAMKQDGDAVPGVRDLTKRTNGIANRPQQCAWQWRTLPVPVIAAVHGVAFGGGFQIMLGADMRYATADARFSVMEIKWGPCPTSPARSSCAIWRARTSCASSPIRAASSTARRPSSSVSSLGWSTIRARPHSRRRRRSPTRAPMPFARPSAS